MPKIYFGKFDKNKPEQIAERFYAAGPQGNPWYGGIEPGDYVFPVSDSRVLGLWKVRRYTEKPNNINHETSGVVEFDEIKAFTEPITVQQFIKSPNFELQLYLLNQIVKTTKRGFYELQTTSSLPPEKIEDVMFKTVRSIYILLQNSPKPPIKPNDLLVVIDNLTDTHICGLQIATDSDPVAYAPWQNLYEEKNPVQERFSLKELLELATERDAPNKAKYITSVLKDLKDRGYFVVDNPVQLYDNILVGPKKVPGAQRAEAGIVEAAHPNLEEEPLEPLDDYMQFAELLEFNPNLILYGPPGTGKTYATKKIIEAVEANRPESQRIPYEQVEKEGRVKFVTFHQSYAYEEFVEGIRPNFDDDGDDASEGTLRYQIQDGILKKMVRAATAQILKGAAKQIQNSSRIWKVSLGHRNDDVVYGRCKSENFIAVGWLDDTDLLGKTYDDLYELLKEERDEDGQKPTQVAHSLNSLVNEMSKGDIVLIYDGRTTIRDIGIITGDYKYLPEEDYPHTRKVDWIKEFEEPVDIYEMNDSKRLTLKTIYELDRMNLSDIQSLLGSESSQDQANVVQTTRPKPYYLVIDEINRGNISKIFGELITLLEKDKRETLQVTLPYSNKLFTLPRNLYVIGTMNTADRSIAMLDTALRRRFAFVEMEPDYTVFSKFQAKVNNTVDLEKLLKALNETISKKLDRDHRIGHAYFLDILTLSDLCHAWYYKVLPLVAEYFYNDVDAIREVVGQKFLDATGSMKFLNMKSTGDSLTEFEKALLAIYEGQQE